MTIPLRERRPPGWSWPRYLVVWWLASTIAAVVFRVMYGVRRSGVEHLATRGPLIYVANHQSHFDPPLVATFTRERPCAFLARSTLFKQRFFRWLIRLFGAIPLQPGQKASGGMRAAIDEIKAGRAMLVFPEGTRSADGTIRAFQSGLLLLIKRTNATVLPVSIEGAHEVWPRQRSRPRLRGRILIRIGAPIPGTELLGVEGDVALERLRKTIETMRLSLRDELREATKGRYPPPGPADAAYWEAGELA